MKRAFRLALFCLMMAAVPLRGYAGALMLFCGSHGENQATQAAQHAHGHHADSGDHGAAHEHEGHGHDKPDHGAGHDPASGSAPACSVCVSCCAGAGLVSTPELPLGFGSPQARATAFAVQPLADFVPDHPERPPSAS